MAARVYIIIRIKGSANMKTTKLIQKAVETSDGAGVKLNRVFGYNETPLFDPFLMLDYFSSENPDDFRRGFPWHPHRGIETITYILKGSVEHQDSLGNKGVIHENEIQWMKAGSGIIHQEMPEVITGRIEGFQLWLNLQAKDKMTDPLYGEIKADMIETVVSDGVTIKIIGGNLGEIRGPIVRKKLGVNLFDIEMNKGAHYIHNPEKEINTFMFVFKGFGLFGSNKDRVSEKSAVLFEGDGGIEIEAVEDMRFLLVEGKMINEPIAWGGPIVMNTREELKTAFSEYNNGTFIKHK